MSKPSKPSKPSHKPTPIAAHLGLDLAKEKVDAAVLTAAGAVHHQTFARTRDGLAALQRWCQQLHITLQGVVMEATNLYFELPAQTLHAAGWRVFVVNPAQAKRFMQSLLQRGKNDRLDAEALARLCAGAGLLKLQAWTPPPPERRALLAQSRGRTALVLQRTALRQQASDAACPRVAAAFTHAAAALDRQVRQLEQSLRQHVAAHPALAREIALLISIPGIGFVTACAVLGELCHLPARASRRAVSAYAGLCPAHRQSGTIAGRSTLSKTGNARLRAALYLPALCALRTIPAFAAFALRLKARGLKPMQAVAAVMRKLLLLASAVLRHGIAYTAHPPLHTTSKT